MDRSYSASARHDYAVRGVFYGAEIIRLTEPSILRTLRTMNTRERRKPDERRESILAAAVEVAKSQRLAEMTRAGVAREAGVAPGLVSHYFGDMAALRAEIMTQAVREGILAIVAEGLALRDPIAQAAPEELKFNALASLS